MKLFKSLLLAPATLGLLAPIAANATEVNLNEISNYSNEESIEFANFVDDNLSVQSPLLAGGEGLVDSFDGGFSETTTASFDANFYAGITSDDGAADDRDDNLGTGYDFTIGLNTSFTGEDSLDVTIETGNANAPGIVELGGTTYASEALTVDAITYTFPVGDNFTVMVGDNTDASSLFTTACVYGGPGDTLDDCGNKNANVDNGGVMAGAEYDFGNGLTAAIGYAGDENDVANEEGVDAYGANLAYTGDNYGVSLTFGAQEDGGEATFPAAQDNMGLNTFYAANAYYTPEGTGLPSISAGYEFGEDDSVVGDDDGLSNFFLGFKWDEVGAGELGIAVGTRVDTVEDTDPQYQYEAWYSYPINDGMTITPLVFMQDVSAANTDDTTGVMVKTSFSF